MLRLIVIVIALLSFGCSNQNKQETKPDIISLVSQQMEYAVQLADQFKDSVLVAPRTTENDKLKLVRARDWTSGFFAGNLWMVYDLTGDEKWKERAIEYTLPLEQEQWDGGTHDLGFKMFNSFGKAYQFTGNETYKNVVIQSAKTLATRFNPNVGCIRSWDHNADKWDFPVIIDNMMNLEMLMWAAKETGNDTLRQIAISHAQTTSKNHFRDDNSSYHVIDYNPETGEVENRNTHQGYSDESAWARGQAWGLYGFTMMYRETGMEEFLVQAEKIAEFILNQKGIKEGQIPYWDFNAPNIPNEPYDASAAAIIVSALYELSTYSNNGNEYKEVAGRLFDTLSSPEFLATVQEKQGFLLKHSTGHLPGGSEIDVPLVYADYYFLESIIKKKNMEKNE
ncbi:MAG: glycoside hydrolase family 88 protein [Draconibacterium sp.]|nr:glycoside hydrolase family 88 protein [Draconibacterium sp.]